MNTSLLKLMQVLSCCLLGISVYAQQFDASLVAMEEQRFKAMVGKDTIVLKKILSNNLLYVHSNGLKETKSDFIHSVASGKIIYGDISREEPPVVAQWGKKTASINGQVKLKGQLQGNNFELHLRYLSLYVKRKGKWELVRWQSAKL